MSSSDETFVRNIFSEFDTDGNGFISSNELHELLAACGVNINEDNLLLELDSNLSGDIDFSTFLAWWKQSSQKEATAPNNYLVYTALRLRYYQRVLGNSLRQVSRGIEKETKTDTNTKKTKTNQAAVRISLGKLDNNPAKFECKVTPTTEKDWNDPELSIPNGTSGILTFDIPIQENVSDFEVGKLAGKLSILLAMFTTSCSCVGNIIKAAGQMAAGNNQDQHLLHDLMPRVPAHVQKGIMGSASIFFHGYDPATIEKASGVVIDTDIKYPCRSKEDQKMMRIVVYFGDIISLPFDHLKKLGIDLGKLIDEIRVTHSINRVFQKNDTTEIKPTKISETKGNENEKNTFPTSPTSPNSPTSSSSTSQPFIDRIAFASELNLKIKKSGMLIVDELITNITTKLDKTDSFSNRSRSSLQSMVGRGLPLIARMLKLSKLQIQFGSLSDIVFEFIDTLEMKTWSEMIGHFYPGLSKEMFEEKKVLFINIMKKYIMTLTNDQITIVIAIVYKLFIYMNGHQSELGIHASPFGKMMSIVQKTIRTIIMEISNAMNLQDEKKRNVNVWAGMPNITMMIKDGMTANFNMSGLDGFSMYSGFLWDYQMGLEAKQDFHKCKTSKDCLKTALTMLFCSSSGDMFRNGIVDCFGSNWNEKYNSDVANVVEGIVLKFQDFVKPPPWFG